MNKLQLQSGSVLMVSLVILLVMTLLGVGSMNTSLLQERMAGNTQMMQTAFQAAESGLRDGEMDVAENITNETVFNANCSNGLCEPAGSGTPVWQDSVKVDWVAPSNTIDYGENTGVDELDYLVTQPRYIIEKLQVVERGSSLKKGFNPQPAGEWYRVTAMGFAGANDQSKVMLQGVYRK